MFKHDVTHLIPPARPGISSRAAGLQRGQPLPAGWGAPGPPRGLVYGRPRQPGGIRARRTYVGAQSPVKKLETFCENVALSTAAASID
jgi:hypothetical protein